MLSATAKRSDCNECVCIIIMSNEPINIAFESEHVSQQEGGSRRELRRRDTMIMRLIKQSESLKPS